MSGISSELRQELNRVMDQILKNEDGISAVTKKLKIIESFERLPGDASTRKYYRLGTSNRTYILMWMEAFPQLGESVPFLAVQRHLKTAEVDVPEVLETDPERGFILLEDLGDITLLRHLQEVASGDIERHLYERIIDSLVHLQVHASPGRKPADIEAYRLRFDHEKLMWEVNFTIEHFYELHLKRTISAEDKKVLTGGFSEICGFLAGLPTVMTHRDFHSRNIMFVPKKPERFVMIDFQDARLGPPQYDLASLLKDSYYQLEDVQVARLLDYYVARYEGVSGERMDRETFLKGFDLMSVQRNFKAIGSFASFLNRRGNATYLKYIGNTFENIRRTLLKYPQYSQLREVLFHYYYF